MNEWILILTVLAGSSHVSTSVTPVHGFANKESCEKAGIWFQAEQTRVKDRIDYRGSTFVCVPRSWK